MKPFANGRYIVGTENPWEPADPVIWINRGVAWNGIVVEVEEKRILVRGVPSGGVHWFRPESLALRS